MLDSTPLQDLHIRVIGTGYVGLVVGACFAELGYRVVCVDKDERKVESLRQGKVLFYESKLESLVTENLRSGRLSFTAKLSPAASGITVFFIAVGTPSNPDGSADLSYVVEASGNIGDMINGYSIVITKSTVPIGTTYRVKKIVQERLKQRGLGHIPFDVGNNPEFLREGSAVKDFMQPNRIVIGTDSHTCSKWIKALYRPLTDKGYPLVEMDVISSEMTKYASNTMLASRISFMNEMSRICDAVGADIESVRKGMVYDNRIGSQFLYPGVGYGGSCFPKDVKALIHTASELQLDSPLLHAIEKVNQEQKKTLVRMVNRLFGNSLKGVRLAVWGLAFKPDTDDIRESPALDTIRQLRNQGAILQVHDPMAMDNAKRELGEEGILYKPEPYEALHDADALLLLTEWPNYRAADLSRINSILRKPIVLDGRNVYDPIMMKEAGIQYFCIGRNASSPQFKLENVPKPGFKERG